MADVIAKLKVDAKEYDGGLAKAKKSLDQFTKQNMSLNGVMAQGISSLTKFASGFAAAELAVKGFNKIVLDGSQTTGDFVRNGIGAMNDTLGVLASSIATMDFGPLINGLDDVYKKALNARESLDSLNDTFRGLGLVASDAREAVAEYREVMADSNATDADKANALKRANDAIRDYGTVINTAKKETDSWVSSTLQASGGFEFETTAEQVKKLVIEYAKLTKAEKDQAREAAKTAAAGRTEYANNLRNVSRSEFTNMGITQSVHRGGTKEQQESAQRDLVAFDNTNKELLRQNVLFERYSDQELDNMANTIQNINSYATQAARMQRQLNSAQNTSTTTKTSANTKVTSKAQESFTSNLNIDDFQPSLNGGLVSMEKLNSLAKEYSDEMASAIDSKRFENAAKEMGSVVNAVGITGEGSIDGMESSVKELTSKAKEFGDAMATAIDEKKFDNAAKKLEDVENAIANFHIKPVEGLEKALPSMNQLITLSKQFSDNMLNATSSEQYESAAKALEKVMRSIEVQQIAIKAGLSMDEAAIQENLQQQVNEACANIQLDIDLGLGTFAKQTQSLSKETKGVSEQWKAVANTVSSAGSAIQNVGNKGLDIAGTVMQAVADIALGFAMAMKSPMAAELGPWAWIAAAAAGTATMIATIASIKSATSGSYAQGGIVPGNYNGGVDSTYVYASPGEVILNRAQQENLLSQLGDGSASGNVTFVLNGEKLEGCLNHYGRRSGKGKVVFA